MADDCNLSPSQLAIAHTVVDVSAGLGIVGSVTLLWLCLRRHHAQRRSVLGRLVVFVALADLATGLWLFTPNLVANGIISVNPLHNFQEWCGYWIAGLRFLQFYSALLAASIALSIMFALLQLPHFVMCLRLAPGFIIPIAVALTVPYIATPAGYQYALLDPDCSPTQLSESIFEWFLIALIIGMTIILAIGLHVLRRWSPESVVKRAFFAAARFIIAFLTSWSIYCLQLLIDWSVPSEDPCLRWVLRYGHRVYVLNGLFNLLAYRVVPVLEGEPRVVTFGAAESFSGTERATSSGTGSSRRSRAPSHWLMLYDEDEEEESSLAGEEELPHLGGHTESSDSAPSGRTSSDAKEPQKASVSSPDGFYSWS